MTMWASVKVKNKKHARAGEAGTVRSEGDEAAGTVPVTWDSDNTTEDVKVDDLEFLG